MNDCLSEIQELIIEVLQDDQNAHEKCHKILIQIQKRFAKGSIYVPFDFEARNAEIVNRYNGKNTRQLAREYGLSLRQISKITQVKKQQMQPSLF